MLKKLTLTQTTDYLQQVSILLNDGYLLQDALQQVQPFQGKKTRRQTLAISNEVQNNNNFIDALEQYLTLEPFLIQILKDAEIKKELPQILEKVVNYREQLRDDDVKVFHKFRQMLHYPFSIGIIALIIISILLIFVVPVFSDMFKSFGGELPELTQFLVNFSNFYIDNFAFILIILLLIILILREGKRSKSRWLYNILNKTAIFGQLYQQSIIICLLRTIHFMFSINRPLNEAFLAMNDLTDQYHARKLKQLGEKLLTGEIPNDSNLPLNVLFMLRNCLNAKYVPTLFVSITEKLCIDLQKRSEKLKQFLDIVALIFIGNLVGLVVIAMYLPIFKMGSVI
jgi:type IV pilus assembly protein PilC